MVHLTLVVWRYQYQIIIFQIIASLCPSSKLMFLSFSLLLPGPLSQTSTLFLFDIYFVFSPSQLPLLLSCSFTQVVSQRFPQNSIGAVGSAMFLRFVNPAIVSPYEAGILEKKPLPRIERGLKLMSKVRTLKRYL